MKLLLSLLQQINKNVSIWSLAPSGLNKLLIIITHCWHDFSVLVIIAINIHGKLPSLQLQFERILYYNDVYIVISAIFMFEACGSSN